MDQRILQLTGRSVMLRACPGCRGSLHITGMTGRLVKLALELATESLQGDPARRSLYAHFGGQYLG